MDLSPDQIEPASGLPNRQASVVAVNRVLRAFAGKQRIPAKAIFSLTTVDVVGMKWLRLLATKTFNNDETLAMAAGGALLRSIFFALEETYGQLTEASLKIAGVADSYCNWGHPMTAKVGGDQFTSFGVQSYPSAVSFAFFQKAIRTAFAVHLSQQLAVAVGANNLIALQRNKAFENVSIRWGTAWLSSSDVMAAPIGFTENIPDKLSHNVAFGRMEAVRNASYLECIAGSGVKTPFDLPRYGESIVQSEVSGDFRMAISGGTAIFSGSLVEALRGSESAALAGLETDCGAYGVWNASGPDRGRIHPGYLT